MRNQHLLSAEELREGNYYQIYADGEAVNSLIKVNANECVEVSYFRFNYSISKTMPNENLSYRIVSKYSFNRIKKMVLKSLLNNL